MYQDKLKALLQAVKEDKLPIEQAFQQLTKLPFENLGFANIDHHRTIRRGYPEVIFCQNKTTEQVLAIAQSMLVNSTVLATRATNEMLGAIKEKFPQAQINELARTFLITHPEKKVEPDPHKKILICSAGTSDLPVAEEAVVTAKSMGQTVESLYDVGVAGIHRLFNNMDKIDAANVIVVVAGMDGALPSVVSGLVDKPVIAVPTSVGYGASFQGVGPLLSMLNACSPGITVVNIDNGFGAGYFAAMINK
ncbi:nickel pincer cofactor biosynthesis protein LarB [Flexithrix dorotheae]|uniref:nickel pincer cofactor biosynthesis protein LarB n=1 Tax=Flexithrix dorotheae TaxID=70993 RepID=UPI000360C702|nr:nickel pincer cofactor biosynthesis protein LarB [Flexithrix dorotheae]